VGEHGVGEHGVGEHGVGRLGGGFTVTVALDTSALLALAVDGPMRAIALEALDAGPVWSASAMALTEALPAIDRLSDEAILRLDLEDAVRRVWDHLHIVPVDQRCLDRAAAMSRTQPVRLSDAIHFAAAERMPAPVRFVTFDAAHIGVALGLGFDVVSS
jgi:predicted nucleic acid-binding protein